jgi:hypothetical protein
MMLVYDTEELNEDEDVDDAALTIGDTSVMLEETTEDGELLVVGAVDDEEVELLVVGLVDDEEVELLEVLVAPATKISVWAPGKKPQAAL